MGQAPVDGHNSASPDIIPVKSILMISPSKHRLPGRVTILAPYSLIAALVVAVTLGPASASDYKCNRVLDGDTIHIVANDTEITLRLFAIDAPETSKKNTTPGSLSARRPPSISPASS